MAENKKKTVYVFTDGSCSGNPGPGGWCAILRYKQSEKVLSGGEDSTTNNRMELSRVLYALAALKEPCEVIVTCDSRYVVDSINLGRVRVWQKNGWRKSDGKLAQNPDLWEKVMNEIERHQVHFNWIRGHSGHPENVRCDEIAVQESQRRRHVNKEVK